MGKSTHVNEGVDRPQGHPGAKDPSVVMARDQRLRMDEPDYERAHHPEDTVCSRCDAVVRDSRWVLDASRRKLLLASGTATEVACPACHRAAEHQPRGILTIAGGYWKTHRDEILNLLGNEAREAMGDNPIERVMRTAEEGPNLVVETTNENLAQRLGRALHRAHKGEVNYAWGDGNHLVRVRWERD